MSSGWPPLAHYVDLGLIGMAATDEARSAPGRTRRSGRGAAKVCFCPVRHRKPPVAPAEPAVAESPVRAPARIEVVLPCGTTLRLDKDVGADALRREHAALRGR